MELTPQTKLPISKEMWKMIAPEWKWAVLGGNGYVYFFDSKPHIDKIRYEWIDNEGWCGFDSVLAISTEGINWSLSLTKRPDDV